MKRNAANHTQEPLEIPRERLTPDEILTIDEVGAILKMKRRSVYELTRGRCRKPLPFFKAGKVLRFRRSEVNRWATNAA